MKKLSIKKCGLLAASLVMMSSVLFATGCSGGGSGDHMSPVDNLVELINERSEDYYELMMSTKPEFSKKLLDKYNEKAMKADDYQAVKKYKDENLGYVYEELDKIFESGDWQIKFVAESETELDDEQISDEYADYANSYKMYMLPDANTRQKVLDDDAALKEYAEEIGADKKEAEAILNAWIKYTEAFEDIEVDDGYEIVGKFCMECGDKVIESQDITIIAVKVNGDWCISDAKMGSSIFDRDLLWNTSMQDIEALKQTVEESGLDLDMDDILEYVMEELEISETMKIALTKGFDYPWALLWD